MGEISNKPRKSYVSEIDISTILHRYTATTLLAMLQEVAHVQDFKIDWNLLVKKTATGITNPREYQMLWRHLAYGDTMPDKVDDVSEPLDDDSDLECELEAFPAVSAEALAEAAACVKVLIASGVPNDPSGSTVEAPLTINIPRGQMTKAHDSSLSSTFVQGVNIMVPVSVQKQQLQHPSVPSAEILDSNGAANANPKRKRKPWTDAEDAKLIAAVQKHNASDSRWAYMSKNEFDGDRTPAQLVQRWSVIKKRNGNLTLGSSVQLSEVQLAARRAITLALDKPTGNSLKSPSNVPVTNGNLGQPCAAEASPALTSLPATQQNSGLAAGQQHSGSLNSQVPATKKPLKRPTLSPDSMVKAAAVAAGARIATPSDAATLLKAAHSKKAVHIMPGGSLLKSSLPGTSSSLPSNVHFIRTGLGPKTQSALGPKHHSAQLTSPGNPQSGGTQQAPGPSTKTAMAAIQPRVPTSASESAAVAEVKSSTGSHPTSKVEVRTAEDSATFSTANAKKEQLQGQADQKSCGQSERKKGEQITSQGDSSKKAEHDQGGLGHPIKDQVEGGQISVLVETSKEKILGDKTVAATHNGLSKQPHQGKSEPLPPSNRSSSGEVTPLSTSTSKGSETTKPASVKQTSDNVKKSEIKNEVILEEHPVAMDIDGEDEKQKPEKQTDGEEKSKK